MEQSRAKELIKNTFENPFNQDNFKNFVINLFKTDFKLEDRNHQTGNYIPEAYRGFVSKFSRVLKYQVDGQRIDALVVTLARGHSVEKARTTQRNLIRDYLLGKFYSTSLKDAALVAFTSPDYEDWRFSLVKIDFELNPNSKGKLQLKEQFTPAKRWSFLVGKNERSHTAQSRLLPLLVDDSLTITLENLQEAFNVEVVTKEFFEKYRDIFIKTKIELDKIVKNNQKVKKEFEQKNINTVDFTKKLLGQIVFLYFLQKKGWFGVQKGESWGKGPKNFIRKLFEKEYGNYKNFYNDILEPLFYEALRTDRSAADHFYSRFNCKIPFLNGGLFDPINNFNWVNTEILLPNELFSNKNRTKEGDIGDGILDVFDRYNFTVNEDEPLEKEVALDPELLGKIYEKLNAIRLDNFNEYVNALKSGRKGDETKFNKEYGVYYTPREIVHYMCQESLKYYLLNELNGNVSEEDLATFIRLADNVQENEMVVLKKKEQIENFVIKKSEYQSVIPATIKANAELIDKLLANIKVCDPAVGSGAFPVGMMHEIVKLRQLLSIFTEQYKSIYELKRHCIENSLYGVDIDPGAVEICKLRFWLSMIVDEEDFGNIQPLPNLDYKIVRGDSLLGVRIDLFNEDTLAKIEKLKPIYFNETNPLKKQKVKDEIDSLIYKISKGHKEFDFNLYFSEVFHEKGGFDIVIGNPPYISNKGISNRYKESLLAYYKFADDTYNHFFFRGIELIKFEGILTFITSKTYWTIQTKKNLRELLLKNKILQIVDVGNPFEDVMVD
ncbi:MAG: BREX-1 system adenine-specific DNA-methyltransferase PglX, partial [Ignavibacterium sp.]|nr:BREX-1 system adenine-specific DNA-methyltransferase PglX [Ignavibacterium sp.]